MSHARWSDIIRYALAGFAAVGLYYLFVLFKLESLGTVFAIIGFISICFLEYYIPSRIKKKIKERKGKQYPIPRPQVQVIQERQERTSFEEFKYCIKCGSEMKKEVKICTKCGHPFEV